jgi:hypothetical protein
MQPTRVIRVEKMTCFHGAPTRQQMSVRGKSQAEHTKDGNTSIMFAANLKLNIKKTATPVYLNEIYISVF